LIRRGRKSNEFAHALRAPWRAAVELYNRYSSTAGGMGTTHLMHAIGHTIKKRIGGCG